MDCSEGPLHQIVNGKSDQIKETARIKGNKDPLAKWKWKWESSGLPKSAIEAHNAALDAVVAAKEAEYGAIVKQRITELVEDMKRLNWLDEQRKIKFSGTNLTAFFSKDNDLRQAIDAAMKK